MGCLPHARVVDQIAAVPSERKLSIRRGALDCVGRRRVRAQHDVGVAGEACIVDRRVALGELHAPGAEIGRLLHIDGTKDAVRPNAVHVIRRRSVFSQSR